jgi:signal transduction histidine kinase/ActR/RegA family two-component response regulator
MLSILHLEDSKEDAFLIEKALSSAGIRTAITVASGRAEFHAALDRQAFDLVLADGSLPGFSALEALRVIQKRFPGLTLLLVSGGGAEGETQAALNAGAVGYVNKNNSGHLIAAVRREEERLRLARNNRRMTTLVAAIQELSLARDLAAIMETVRRAARELTGADGATFILRDGNLCHYADENAIQPLWKGQKFPMERCVSGWVMINRRSTVIEDIYSDPRVPAEAYRPTFVKSMAMVPIRSDAPIGAIGNYWATRRLPTSEEIELLELLANTTAVAMENVRVQNELEQRVKQRTMELQAANAELESFAESISHDLGAPVRCIRGFAEILMKECGSALSESGQMLLERIEASAVHMRSLIDDLMRLSRVTRTELKEEEVNLTKLAREILKQLSAAAAERVVETRIADGLTTRGDRALLRIALENLLSNAWKYTGKSGNARIEFGTMPQADGSPAFYVRDNGAGFNMEYAGKLFQPFQRMHPHDDFPGSGIGLTIVHRIIHRHGGRLWAEGEVNKGATFYFALTR